MGRAIVYTSVTGAAALVSFLWYLLDRGEPALLACVASGLAIAIVAPILMRKDFQFVGIPGPVEIFFSLLALGGAIYAGLKRNEYWFWATVAVQTLPTFRVSLVSLKAYQRPLSLKLTVGAFLAGLIGLNAYLGVRHGGWLGETVTALVKEWFPDATAVKDRTPAPPPPKNVNAPPVAPPKTPVDAGPIATIEGRKLTKEMVIYQQYIDSLVDDKLGRNDAVAALLRAFVARAILEKKFKAFEPAMLKDEHQWLMNRFSDSKVVEKIRNHGNDELFLNIYVGANGLYNRKLAEIFEKRKHEELKKRAAEVLKEVQVADGVERPGPKVEHVQKDECRYVFSKREFVPKFSESDPREKANPNDQVAKDLANLKINTTLPYVIWGDMNGLVVRRVQNDFKGLPIYEVYRVVEKGVYSSWFKKQCSEFLIEIPDPELRSAMLEMAKDVNHIIKAK